MENRNKNSSLTILALSVAEITLGTACLFSPVALIFFGGVAATFGGQIWPFLVSLVAGIVLLASGLSLVIDGDRRFRSR